MDRRYFLSAATLLLGAVLLLSFNKPDVKLDEKQTQHSDLYSSQVPGSKHTPNDAIRPSQDVTAEFNISTQENLPKLAKATDRGLDSKIANEQRLQMQLISEMAAQKNAISNEQMMAIQKASIQIVDHAKNGLWNEFIASFEELRHHGSEISDLSLYQAVAFEAPWKVIDTLINNGANITDSLVLLLASRNNADLTEKLIEKGLNIHATDHLGKNALDYSINGAGNKLKFVKYLLNNNVSLTPVNVVRDPLDSALEGYSNGSASIAIISMLVNYGAPIEESHKESMAELIDKSPEKYWLLTQSVPELLLTDKEDSS